MVSVDIHKNEMNHNNEIMSPTSSLHGLRFDNRFYQAMPADQEDTNHVRQVYRAGYSPVNPTPVKEPHLVAWSPEAAALIDLAEADCRSALFTDVFAGNQLLPGMQPFAMNYGGHQFGNWAGQLGDGRAINLGEVLNHRKEHWTLQLKGAGLTPYSRSADGRAVLRSSLREYLCSEAMHHLGIATTRALSLILTGEAVVRDMFYDGHPASEPGAVVCRMSPSFVRFGNFEIHAVRKEVELLRTLADFTIGADFPHLLAEKDDRHRYLQWLAEIARTTGELIAQWMRVGFVHGVMNTDNMSILGLSIDYGPYGWLEGYDPTWTPNTTDSEGRRYCFGNQPYIGQWNLMQLANALYPLVQAAEPLQDAVDEYRTTFQSRWQQIVHEKLGLEHNEEDDAALINDLFELLTKTETDYTIFFRRLALIGPDEGGFDGDPLALLMDAYYQPDALDDDYRAAAAQWLTRYRTRLTRSRTPNEQRVSLMNRTNPKYVFRNYLAQLAIDKVEQGDFGLLAELHEVLRHPYDEQPEYEQYAVKRPEWARNRAGCSMLSCSS
jgi:uncharacterized protein YdiU (UPF0061 family)